MEGGRLQDHGGDGGGGAAADMTSTASSSEEGLLALERDLAVRIHRHHPRNRRRAGEFDPHLLSRLASLTTAPATAASPAGTSLAPDATDLLLPPPPPAALASG